MEDVAIERLWTSCHTADMGEVFQDEHTVFEHGESRLIANVMLFQELSTEQAEHLTSKDPLPQTRQQQWQQPLVQDILSLVAPSIKAGALARSSSLFRPQRR